MIRRFCMMGVGMQIHPKEAMNWCQSKPAYEKIKRISDLLLSSILLAGMAVPMLMIAFAVRLDSPGPAFYLQFRLGMFGKPFPLLKFRTMKQDAEREGPVWAEREDARRTKIGILLRRFHLDELPQLINILMGDMSFVGPRPERAIFYESFKKSVSGFDKRLLVKPGLTGLAQISGGYDLSPLEKWEYDMRYIRERSVLVDFKCLMLTIPAVLSGRGAR